MYKMPWSFLKKALAIAGLFVGAAVAIRYLLPVLWPFAAGALVALAAEPLVRLSTEKLRLRRTFAAGLGVSVTLLMLFTLAWFAGALLLRRLMDMASELPDLGDTAMQGVAVLRNFLMEATESLPETLRTGAQQTVEGLFDDSRAIVSQAGKMVSSAATAVLSRVPNGAFGVGTGIFSSYLISARLPKLKKGVAASLPQSYYEKVLPKLRKVRRVLFAWLKAQLKLMLLCFGIVSLGLMILQVKNAALLALLVAVVDAVPMVGSGVILLPWALIALLQSDHFLAIGLLCTYGAASLSRSLLEPRIVGRQLGLDPLLTLFSLYAGFRLLGLPGLLLAPFFAMAIKMLFLKK